MARKPARTPPTSQTHPTIAVTVRLSATELAVVDAELVALRAEAAPSLAERMTRADALRALVRRGERRKA
jgi:hypothetical protein